MRAPAITIQACSRGRRRHFTVTCSTCGPVGRNTTEEYANERGRDHVALDHGLVDAEVSA